MKQFGSRNWWKVILGVDYMSMSFSLKFKIRGENSKKKDVKYLSQTYLVGRHRNSSKSSPFGRGPSLLVFYFFPFFEMEVII